ncbi:MAG: biotin--[acetyl-CoA-carboxylase] ligase [Bacteroidetes bacterium]|nr:biotin--[acetyl-CoA-carboxylase] ligase [Bacteroidota bacterium]
MYTPLEESIHLGGKVIFLPRTASTNSELQKFAQGGNLANGTVLITDEQYAGRGQAGNQWMSQSGVNLTFSIYLSDAGEVNAQFQLNIFITLGILDFLKKSGLPAKVKWPNDILIHGKKICGILIENSIGGNRITHSIVGIGLNVNQQSDLPQGATSMAQLTGSALSLQKSFHDLLRSLESRYVQWKSGKTSPLKEEWLSSLYLKGEPHIFTVAGKPLPGTISGIDETGRLTVVTQDGTQVFGFKEITF